MARICLLMWDLMSNYGQPTAHERAETPAEKSLEDRRAILQEKMEGSILLWKLMYVSEKTWNGEGNLLLDRNVIERRQRNLTKKG